MDVDGVLATADVWTDRLAIADQSVEVLGRFVDGPAAGRPALTRRPVGRGAAWYLGTRLDPAALGRLMHELYTAADIVRISIRHDIPVGLEMVSRKSTDATFHFFINHNDHPVAVDMAGTDVVTETHYPEGFSVPATQVMVVRQS